MSSKRADLGVLLLLVVLVVGALLVLTGCEEANTGTEETTESTQAAAETTEAVTETTATTEAAGATETTEAGVTESTAGGEESLSPVSDQFKVCADCHSDFNQFLANSKVLTSNFSHALHLNKGYKCEACHVVPTHEPDKINKPPMLKCFDCHGQEADAIAPGKCSVCHPADFPLVPANHSQANWLPSGTPAPDVKTVSAQHSEVASQDPAYCAMCHAQQFCQNCHKVDMPHPGDWLATHPQTVSSVGQQACTKCHPNDLLLCNSCHHEGFQAGTPWRQQHPSIVQSNGAENCFQCHSPLTCAHCHITGEFKEVKPGG